MENKSEFTSLEQSGFDEFFSNAAKDLIHEDFIAARIVEVNKGSYRVMSGRNEMIAELSGKFMFSALNSTDYPTVGDWVIIQALDNNSLAIIHNILPRKSLLKRKEAGKKVDFQLIAANIDYGLIVQPANALNTNALDRYLVMLNESKIESVIVLTKTDLVNATEMSELEERISALNSKHVFVSNITDGGINALSGILHAGKTYCLLGPSGVGKTSILNSLLGDNLYRVNEIREKDGRGRHTTVRRQLIELDCGSIFIDTPGMRELGNFDVAGGIQETFETIISYGANCRYRDCTHTLEEGCAVIEAVKLGEIDEERYQNYLKIRKESAHYEMSYLEKRKKDKAFGKMVSDYKKFKKNNH